MAKRIKVLGNKSKKQDGGGEDGRAAAAIEERRWELQEKTTRRLELSFSLEKKKELQDVDMVGPVVDSSYTHI
jgi:hypothetical protein